MAKKGETVTILISHPPPTPAAFLFSPSSSSEGRFEKDRGDIGLQSGDGRSVWFT